eukprot:594792-Prymnesium_polylepis.1
MHLATRGRGCGPDFCSVMIAKKICCRAPCTIDTTVPKRRLSAAVVTRFVEVSATSSMMSCLTVRFTSAPK